MAMPTVRFYQKYSFKVPLWITIIILPMLVYTGYMISSMQSDAFEGLIKQKGITAALLGAKAYSAILESGVNSGDLKMEDVVGNIKYEPIHYPFDVKVPRFHTPYDRYTDTHGIQAMQDACKESSSDIIYCSGIAEGGYVPTPHREYANDPTGDHAWDAKHSRTKQKYTGEPLLASGFRGSKATPYTILPYQRDVGGECWDVVAEITVKGEHFGAFRVGVRKDRVSAFKWQFIVQLIVWFGYLTFSILFVVTALVWSITRHLKRLARIGLSLAQSEEIDSPIIPGSNDEIGQLEWVFERLRKTIRDAIERLMKH